MNRDMLIAKEIALQADNFYDVAKSFGERAARAFRRNHRAQITGLESIANSSLKSSDVLDYLKIRTARSDRDSGDQPQRWSVGNLGRDLVAHLNGRLKEVRNRICATLGIDLQSAEAQGVYLALIREFIRQLATHYEYEAMGGGGNEA